MTIATVGRKSLPVLAAAVSLVAMYAAGLAVYIAALLVWDDVHDGIWLRALVRGAWVLAVPVSCVAAFRFVDARRRRTSAAIIGAALACLLIALPLLAWGILTISDFSGID